MSCSCFVFITLALGSHHLSVCLPSCPQVTGWEVEGRELKRAVQRLGTKSVVRVETVSTPTLALGPHTEPPLEVVTVTQPFLPRGQKTAAVGGGGVPVLRSQNNWSGSLFMLL